MSPRVEIEDLLFEILESEDRHSALDRACEAHSEHAEELRDRFAYLQGLGLGARGVPVGALVPGQVIGDYRLRKLVGSGGMGQVWEATQESLGGRRVALKFVLYDPVLYPKVRERFEREILLASRLDHSGICRVYGVGEHRGEPFLVLQFVEGRDLASLVDEARERREPIVDVRRGETAGMSRLDALVLFFEKAALALQAAHDGGVLHRDLKPGNLMVTADGAPVLLDFGLARGEQPEQGPALTLIGDAIGTPAYLPPERLCTGYGEPGRRGDVYSLAASLYEALTLHRPFEAAQRQSLQRRILEDPLPNPRRWVPAVPRPLVVVLECAMAKDPDRRYETARDLAQDLARVRRREPILARRSSAMSRTMQWARRNPVVAGLLALLALTAALLLLLLLRVQGLGAEMRSAALVGESLLARQTDPAKSLRLAAEAARTHPSAEAEQRLYEAMAEHREIARVELGGEGHSVVFHRGGFASATRDGQLCHVDAAGRVTARANIAQQVLGVVAMPEAPVLVLTAAGLWTWDPAAGAPIARAELGERWTFVAAPRTGTRVLLAGKGTAMQWDAATSTQVARTAAEAAFTAGTLAPTGHRCFLGDAGGRLWSWDPDSATPPQVLAHVLPGRIHRVVMLPLAGAQGSVAAVSSAVRGQVAVLELAAGRVARHEGNVGFMADLVAAPSSEWCVSASAGKSITVFRASGEVGIRSTANGHESSVNVVKFSPSGRIFASGAFDGTVRLWDIRGVERGCLRGHGQDVLDIAFQPDERVLASVGQDRTLRLWSVDEPAPTISHPYEAAAFVAQELPGADAWFVLSSDLGIWRYGPGDGAHRFGGRDHPGAGGGWIAIDRAGDLLVRAGSIRGPAAQTELLVWKRILGEAVLAARAGPIADLVTALEWFPGRERLLVVTRGSPPSGAGFQIWKREGETLAPVAERAPPAPGRPAQVNFGTLLSGNRVALGWKTGHIQIVSTEGEVLQELVHRLDVPIRRLLWLEGSSILASADRDGEVALFQDRAGRLDLIRRWQAHEGRTWSLKPAKAGLVTAAGDGRIRVWQLDGTLRREFQVAGREVHDAWQPEGTEQLRALCADGRIRCFELDIRQAIDRAEARLGPRQ